MVFSLRTQHPLFLPISLFSDFHGHTFRYSDTKMPKQPIFEQLAASVSVTEKKRHFFAK